MFHAFNAATPGGIVELAMAILKADKRNHKAAVEMAGAVKDATIALVVAMSLVTQCQNPDNPVVSITDGELLGEPTEGHNPAELLEALAGGFPESEWGDLVEVFQETYNEWLNEHNKKQAKKDLEKMPEGDLFVSDILGEE